MARARCRGEQTELFYDEHMIKSRKFVVFCEACPVRSACGEYAFKNKETYGVWGGMTPMEALRTATAMASLGRQSTSSSWPGVLRRINA